jgi:hypothetical protein
VKAEAQPSREREALEYAVEFFQTRATSFTTDRGWRHLTAGFVEIALNSREKVKDKFIDDVIEFFRLGATGFFPFLRELAIVMLERGDQLPESLRKLVVEFLRDPEAHTKRNRGRSSQDLMGRNLEIKFVISQIVKRWKFSPTRNTATERASAASIVREALKQSANVRLTEAAINDIWGGSWFVRSIIPKSDN